MRAKHRIARGRALHARQVRRGSRPGTRSRRADPRHRTVLVPPMAPRHGPAARDRVHIPGPLEASGACCGSSSFMSFATHHSRALRGLEAKEVKVEVHLTNRRGAARGLCVRRRALARRRAAPGPRLLAIGLALRRNAGAGEASRTLVLPRSSAVETALVGGLRLLGAGHLLGVVRVLLPGAAADASALHEPEAPPRRAAAALPDPARRQGPGVGQARSRDRGGWRA